jgi:hypothetical protein
MDPDHHRVFLYTPDLSVSNQKKNRQRRLAIFQRLPQERTKLIGLAIFERSNVIFLERGRNDHFYL